MKKIILHLTAVRKFIKEKLMGGALDKSHKMYKTYYQLTTLEDDINAEGNNDMSDRLLKKHNMIDAMIATYFEGREGTLTSKEVRKHLEQVFDAGFLAGMADERNQTYEIAAIIKGGIIQELWADRPNLLIHKIDIDRDSDQPVYHSEETAEYASTFNIKEILKSLE